MTDENNSFEGYEVEHAEDQLGCPFCGADYGTYDADEFIATFACGSGYSIGGAFQSVQCMHNASAARAKRKPDVDEVLKPLRGDHDKLRTLLLDKDHLLEKLCSYAEVTSQSKKIPAWSIIGQILGHGSGVSSAIYELYRARPVEKVIE